MVRLIKLLLFATAFFTGIAIAVNQTYAQSLTATATPTVAATTAVTATASPLSTPRTLDTVDSETVSAANVTPSATEEENILFPTPTVAASSVTSPTAADASVATTSQAGPLEGTILANRSDEVAQFFLEGQTYLLEAGRSQGFALPRTTTVLNLFNCPGDLPTETAGCFWDPYLIMQDGFYEVYNAAEAGESPQMMLREAGAPPSGQVYVQNRTENTESVVFRDEVYEIEPSLVAQFPVATGVPAILYVRNCLTIDNHSACEWAPRTLHEGVYYALIEVDQPASQNGSSRTNIDLQPVIGEDETSIPSTESEPSTTSSATASAATATTTSQTMVRCSVIVPALNVRSGPGLQYDIIGKVRTAEDGSLVTVDVTGRSADNEWLTVAADVAAGGWINNSPSFITCTGDVLSLAVIEAPAIPTPVPSSVVQAPAADPIPANSEQADAPAGADVTNGEEEVAAPETEGGGEASSEEGASATIPEGQSMLVIHNGFQHEMRFTLDQQYRPIEGPSEFDLQPGQSVNVIVYPGTIPFTGSTPWSGLSGNASITIGADESATLWLRFEAEEDDSWVFRWN